MHLLNDCGISFKYNIEKTGDILIDVIQFKTIEGLRMEFVNVLDEDDRTFFAIEDDKEKREKVIRRNRPISKA